MIADLFGLVKDGLVGFFQALSGAFSGVTSIIWDTTANTPTFLGSLLVIGAVVGMGYMAFRIIRRLCALRG